MSQQLGIAVIAADGKSFDTSDGATLDIGGVKRATVKSAQRVVGYAEEPMPSVVDCEIHYDGATKLEEIRNLKDATITFKCDTGQKYVVSNAHLVDTPVVTAKHAGGTVKLKFEGPPAKELK